MKKNLTQFFFLALLFLSTFVASGQKKLLAIFTESYVGSSYVPYDSVVTTYNTQNQVIKETRKLYTSGTWNNFSKDEYTYLTSGEVDKITSYNWVNNAWQNAYEYLHIYDAGKNLVKIDQYRWKNNKWVKDYVFQYLYRTDKKLDSLNLFSVDSLLKETAYEQIKHDYTTHGELASTTTKRWSSTAGWELKIRWMYFYDLDYTLLKKEEDNYLNNQWFHIHNYSYSYGTDKLLRDVMHKNSATGQNIGRSKYKYEGDPTSVSVTESAMQQTSTTLFPNPVSSGATVSLGTRGNYTFTISDICGKKVLQQLVLNSDFVSFTTDMLENGAYFYTLTNANGQVAHNKFIISK